MKIPVLVFSKASIFTDFVFVTLVNMILNLGTAQIYGELGAMNHLLFSLCLRALGLRPAGPPLPQLGGTCGPSLLYLAGRN